MNLEILTEETWNPSFALWDNGTSTWPCQNVAVSHSVHFNALLRLHMDKNEQDLLTATMCRTYITFTQSALWTGSILPESTILKIAPAASVAATVESQCLF